MKALYHKYHPGSLKLPKWFSNWMNFPKLIILQHHPDHLYVFTYGSKDNNKTMYAAVWNKKILKKALPMESSMFTAEAHAIDLALNIKIQDSIF